MGTDTKFAGTSQLPHICWALFYDNGQQANGLDVEPHYDSEREATEDIGEYTHEPLGAPTPRQLDRPCFIATARCGYVFDAENTAVTHFETAEDVYKVALDCGFTDMGDGTLRCSDDCEDCA